MTMTPRESTLALATGVVLISVMTGVLLKPRIERWKTLRLDQKTVRSAIELSQKLVDSRDRWIQEYEGLSKVVPRYAADQAIDIHLRSIMERAAAKHNLRILDRKVGDETRQGAVYEMPIECPNWEGTLDALVGFLFALNNEEALMDVRQLNIRPPARGKLRGRFSITCIYMRAEPE